MLPRRSPCRCTAQSTRFRVQGWGIEWEGGAQRVRPLRRRTQSASGAMTTGFSSETVRSQSDLSMVWADGRYLLTYKNSRVGFEEAEAPAFVADPLDPMREVVLSWTTL